MSLTIIGAYQARQNFGELLEKAFYQGKNFLVKRGNKTMAYIVGQPFFNALFSLIENDKALADTLALMTNPLAKQVVEKGSKEIKDGKTYPLKKLLED